ncbi:MAG TPA: protein phosphatase [Albidovulum sp.]|uniref:protein-tyrosine phosphatase family protein n=1 Tax=Albidovulum sp. TaxID=1872424 RepID=UPI002D0493DA|nr:protein phosphatase [Albidovulum sp.]
MAGFAIAELEVGGGWIGLCPMPGRSGDYSGDLAKVIGWGPALVVSMTVAEELAMGAAALPGDLRAKGIVWRHLPVADFAAASPALAEDWDAVAAEARTVLTDGGRVLFHCMGGCGRSGMAVLRLMVEAGEAPEAALVRLRRARPCAVETGDQFDWAAKGGATAR